MNYIKQLQEENARLGRTIAKALTDLADFQRFLNTDKFIGTCPIDGSRKDWISTGDVITFLAETRQRIVENRDNL